MDAAELLRARHEDIARDLVREEGKTFAEAKGEVRRAIDVFRYFGSAGWRFGGDVLPSATPDTTIFTRAEPIGVAALITPWNFPIAIPAWKLAPALVSGNTVVLKPADLTPLSATHLASALMAAGLPAGVLNVVHGPGSVVGDALARDPRVGAFVLHRLDPGRLGLHELLSRAVLGYSSRWVARTATSSSTTPTPSLRRRWSPPGLRAHRPGLHGHVTRVLHPWRP